MQFMQTAHNVKRKSSNFFFNQGQVSWLQVNFTTAQL